MHGRSELVGYPVRLIPVTSEIPSRFGAINAIAFRRNQIGTKSYLLDVRDYNRSVMLLDALGCT